MKSWKRIARVCWLAGLLALGSSLSAAQNCSDEDSCERAPTNPSPATPLAAGLVGLAAAFFVTRKLRFRDPGSPRRDALLGESWSEDTGSESSGEQGVRDSK